MTHDEAKGLKAFKSYCNCGGYALSMNNRNANHPHMTWCPQYKEWHEWNDAMKKGPQSK